MKKIELEVITLGQPRVVVDGQEVQRKDWHCNLARLLFFLAVDVSPVRRNELAVHLWPDMSPRQMKLNFHSVRWQMNAALGAKNLYRCDELADNIYAFDPDRVEIQHDTARFQHAVHEARAIARTSQNGAVVTAWQKAIGLYGGDYLAGIPTQFVWYWVDWTRWTGFAPVHDRCPPPVRAHLRRADNASSKCIHPLPGPAPQLDRQCLP